MTTHADRDHGDITVVWSLPESKGGGPVHAMQAGYHLSWCGKRPQFRHRVRPGTTNVVDCPACIRAITANQPRAYRSR